MSFLENAEIKARHYFNQLQRPVIADDSGLVVPALNGQPGIHSARYAGEQAAYRENNQRLLRKMAKLTGNARRAYFVCVVVYFDGTRVIWAEGRAEGLIIREEKGTTDLAMIHYFFIRRQVKHLPN